ncbi:MAG: hypothetical protein M1420_00735 [Actinobacteria bacterium]|nr:hypothetical protein [Actinomycetota bacterium]
MIDIESDHEPVLATMGSGGSVEQHLDTSGHRVTVKDLLDARLIEPDEQVVFDRPKLDAHYTAVITADGTFELADGTRCAMPSSAAMQAAGMTAANGWQAWRVSRLGLKLADLRKQYLHDQISSANE